MKQNRLTTLLAAGAVSAIALTSAFAEESTATATPTESATTATSTSTTPVEASGVVVTFKPGLDFIMVKTESSTAPIMYYYTKSTTVVGKDGKTGDWAMIKPDMTVKYTYVNDGDRMVITRLEVQKPKSSSEKPATAKP